MSEVFFTFISNDFVFAPSVRFEADCLLIRKCKYLYRTVHWDAFVLTATENTSKYLCSQLPYGLKFLFLHARIAFNREQTLRDLYYHLVQS